MQKKVIWSLVSAFAVTILSLGVYYVGFHIPQKQKLEIEKAKLELEAKIQQEKTEQARIEEQYKKEKEEQEEEDRQKEEAEKQAQEEENKKIQANRNACLAKAKTYYQNTINNIGDYSPSIKGMSPSGIVSTLEKANEYRNSEYERASDSYENLKNECYHKYPLPNEDF